MIKIEINDAVNKLLTFLKDHLTVSIAVILVFSSFNVKFYYYFLFNFDVIPFISVQELLTTSFLTLGDLNWIIIISLLILMPTVQRTLLFHSRNVKTSSKFIQSIKKILFSTLFIFAFYPFVELLIYSLYEMWINHHEKLQYNSREPYIIGLLCILFFTIVLYVINIWKIFPLSLNQLFALIFLIQITIGTIVISYVSGLSIKYNREFVGTKVVTADTVITSSRKFMYIGQTNNFIFHHDFESQSTNVIPISEMKSASIVRRAGHNRIFPFY